MKVHSYTMSVATWQGDVHSSSSSVSNMSAQSNRNNCESSLLVNIQKYPGTSPSLTRNSVTSASNNNSNTTNCKRYRDEDDSHHQEIMMDNL